MTKLIAGLIDIARTIAKFFLVTALPCLWQKRLFVVVVALGGDKAHL
jgi:hypothetical protein